MPWLTSWWDLPDTGMSSTLVRSVALSRTRLFAPVRRTEIENERGRGRPFTNHGAGVRDRVGNNSYTVVAILAKVHD